jgi:hypothetical protein
MKAASDTLGIFEPDRAAEPSPLERHGNCLALEWPNHGNNDATMKKTAKGQSKIDWSGVDAMTVAAKRTLVLLSAREPFYPMQRQREVLNPIAY